MKKVSLVMIVKNEEKHLMNCLMSAKDSVDEIIVVDTGSSDKTVEVAKQFGAKVFEFEWTNHFSEARNFALSFATGEWILMLDADEMLANNYSAIIQNHINQTELKIGRIKIISRFEEDGIIQESFAYISRLFPRGIQFTGRIHEQLDTDIPRVILDMEASHEGYYQTNKSDRNIPLIELELQQNPNDSYFLYQLGKEYRNQNDYLSSSRYFNKGYSLLNKTESYAPTLIAEYIHSLTKSEQFSKGLQVIRKEEEFLSQFPDFFFAKGILLMNFLSHNPNAQMQDIEEIEKAFLTCLKIGENGIYDSMIGTGSYLPSYNLSILYELLGLQEKSLSFLKQAALSGFEPAIFRLKEKSV